MRPGQGWAGGAGVQVERGQCQRAREAQCPESEPLCTLRPPAWACVPAGVPLPPRVRPRAWRWGGASLLGGSHSPRPPSLALKDQGRKLLRWHPAAGAEPWAAADAPDVLQGLYHTSLSFDVCMVRWREGRVFGPRAVETLLKVTVTTASPHRTGA